MTKNLFNNIWYPFTQMQTSPQQIHVDRAEGSLLYTSDNKQIIDAISSWWVNLHGHTHPNIVEAIAHQANTLEHVIFAGFTHSPAQKLASNLLSILPHNFSQVFFSDDGSTSVEVALKMVLQYWHNKENSNKKKIIALEGAYHGDTFGAMSVAGHNDFNKCFNDKMFDIISIPVPKQNNREQVFELFYSLISKNDIAGFIYEPLVQGANGMNIYLAEDLDILVDLAKQNDVLCIADEVMTGFGRTGKYFASSYLNSLPDIICLSKGITGGFLPLGVTCTSQDIYNAFLSQDSSKTFFHGHSYTANPIACAAANASFLLLTSQSCQDNINFIANRHANFIHENCFFKDFENIRALGTILAFDLNVGNKTSYFNSFRDKIYNHCLSQGVLLRPLGNVIYTMPPYCITDKELQKIYSVMISCKKLIL